MFRPDEPAFARTASENHHEGAAGFTKREYIRLEVFKAMCQNTPLVTALANMMHPSQLKEQLIKQALEFADDFIRELQADSDPAANPEPVSNLFKP